MADTSSVLTVRLGHLMILAFRDADKNRQDILNDTPNGIAHRGFLSAYESVENDLAQAELINRIKQLGTVAVATAKKVPSLSGLL